MDHQPGYEIKLGAVVDLFLPCGQLCAPPTLQDDCQRQFVAVAEEDRRGRHEEPVDGTGDGGQKGARIVLPCASLMARKRNESSFHLLTHLCQG